MEANQNQKEETQDTIQIQELVYWCLKRWYWFIASLAVTLGLAIFYLLKATPVYTRSAELLIKEDSKGNSFSTNLEQSFSNMGLMKLNTNVNNEILAIKSLNVICEVVKRLDLNVNYLKEGRFHKEVAYGSGLPMKVSLIDFPEEESGSFTLNYDGKGHILLTDLTRNSEEWETVCEGGLNGYISTPLGSVQVKPTPYYVLGEPVKLYVSHAPRLATARGFSTSLGVSLSDKNATVINLTLNDASAQRAEDILNTVIDVYNESWLKDKNEIAVSTSKFINERLAVIERELGEVDENISTFKSKNLLPDVQAASNLYMTQHTQTNSEIIALNNQLYMTRYIRKYITEERNKEQLLPMNSGIENINIESQISQYNTKLLERNNLVLNSSEENPLVADLDIALHSMRAAIIISIDNQLETLKAQIQSLEKSEEWTTSQIAANPTQAKYLLSIERQQKVKEALYLFLLQKREENELSQAFTAYNSRVMTKPNGNTAPTSPKRSMVLLIAAVLGLALPVLVIFLREFLNVKVRGRNDLENLSIPFIGEIPLYINPRKGLTRAKDKGKNIIVVKEGNRDIINEAFRILRTNLEFITEKKNGNVILLTSYNQGSGKSFLAMNTALSLAIKNKRVLVIDGDLRYASVSTYVDSPKQGLSSYLNGLIDEWRILAVPDKKYPNLHILPVGIIPPNPTELLFSDRLKNLIDEVRETYDYVFIDCPPIEVVADVQIIEKYVDRTMFVIRAGLLERRMLSDLQNLYDEKKYKNMVLVLNGTESPVGYYDYKYAYRCSYHYGHNLKKFSHRDKHKSHKWIVK